MNPSQRRILGSWRQLLWKFIEREWLTFFVASAMGVAAAEIVHLVLQDHTFQAFLSARYKPAASFDDPKYYTPYLLVILAILILATGPAAVNYGRRGFNSLLAGVTSGLTLLPFTSAFLLAMGARSSVAYRVSLGCALGSVWVAGTFALHLKATVSAERTIADTEIKVPSSKRSQSATQPAESDEPIEAWEQDTLGRAALVDILSIKILIGKAPAIAISGAFGTGKTSILNLLREHLEDKAIIIFFSTWLPGSQETLTSYLLADIASECQKQYIVPGLRQSARRFAAALGQKVPFLSDYMKLLPATTQKDNIEKLKMALLRLPKRVVVLLDEIDRMEKDELLTLLKVIRGISTLPNLSFVCAGDREVIVKTVKGEVTNETLTYFDKFFPMLIPVPEPSPDALRSAGTQRLVTTFEKRDWFEDEPEKVSFLEELNSVWPERIGPLCRNMRSIGLLANDVSVAAGPLRREVDPLDLTLAELLRRFRPAVYELISQNGETLTGGESIVRGGTYLTDKEKEANQKRFLDELEATLQGHRELEIVKGILAELFPKFLKNESRLRRQQPKQKAYKEEESEKRISEPSIFPAYFRYELPGAIFSYVEMASVEQRLELATDQAARDATFGEVLASVPKGSLKRDDFLRRLSERTKTIRLPLAKTIGQTAIRASDKYTYDIMPAFGEAGHVLRMTLWIANRLSRSDRLAFLRECVLAASDDTMAFNILRILTNQKDTLDLKVTAADLYKSFAERMRKRYGRYVDATNIDLSTSDPWAFDYWGRDLAAHGFPSDPDDRKMQNDFWLRYIGNSRARLADAFRGFLFPVAAYSDDPALGVGHKIDMENLKRLDEELPEDPNLTEQQTKSLALLRRLLSGEFKRGVDPTSGIWG